MDAETLQTLASFVPSCLLRKIAIFQNCPSKASVTSFDGVLVFMDVSGFSRLTTWLTAREDKAKEDQEQKRQEESQSRSRKSAFLDSSALRAVVPDGQTSPYTRRRGSVSGAESPAPSRKHSIYPSSSREISIHEAIAYLKSPYGVSAATTRRSSVVNSPTINSTPGTSMPTSPRHTSRPSTSPEHMERRRTIVHHRTASAATTAVDSLLDQINGFNDVDSLTSADPTSSMGGRRTKKRVKLVETSLTSSTGGAAGLDNGMLTRRKTLDAQHAALLSEALHGAQSTNFSGAEALRDVLNNYFGKLAEDIGDYGGVVIKFAGDAVISIFEKQDNEPDLVSAAQRACLCCLNVQQNLHTFKAAAVAGEEAPIQLQLHIAIGAGKLAGWEVGGHENKWSYLITGEPMKQIKRAIDAAHPGQVVLSPEAWGLVAGRCKASMLASGDLLVESIMPVTATPATVPALHSQMEMAIKCWIPSPVLARTSNLSEWMSELRRASTIFVNLPELDPALPGIESSLKTMQTAYEILQRNLHKYGGAVKEFVSDDKGFVLVAGFGLPPHAHEDDAGRACHSVLAMLRELQKINMRVGAAITTGRIFCGWVGSTARRDYAMTGQKVVEAARLMQAASTASQRGKSGDQNADTTVLYCDTETMKAAKERVFTREVNFEEMAPLKVKGRDDPIPVYRVLGAANSETQQNSAKSRNKEPSKKTWFGRSKEIAIYEDQLHRLRSGDAKNISLVIEGPPGIGKSFFLQEIVRRADEDSSLRAILISAEAIERDTPFAVWRNIISRVLRLDECQDTDEAKKIIHSYLQHFVLQLLFPEGETSQRLSPRSPDVPALAGGRGSILGSSLAASHVSALRRLLGRVISHTQTLTAAASTPEGQYRDGRRTSFNQEIHFLRYTSSHRRKTSHSESVENMVIDTRLTHSSKSTSLTPELCPIPSSVSSSSLPGQPAPLPSLQLSMGSIPKEGSRSRTAAFHKVQSFGAPPSILDTLTPRLSMPIPMASSMVQQTFDAVCSEPDMPSSFSNEGYQVKVAGSDLSIDLDARSETTGTELRSADQKKRIILKNSNSTRRSAGNLFGVRSPVLKISPEPSLPLLRLPSTVSSPMRGDDPDLSLIEKRSAAMAAIVMYSCLLNSVLSVNFPETEATSQMGDVARSEILRHLLLALLDSYLLANDTPLLLCLDNIEDVDAASWALLLSAMQSMQSLMIISTARSFSSPDTDQPSLAAISAVSQSHERLLLHPLELKDISDIICERTGASSIPADLVQVVWDKTQGNPLYSVEFFLSLVRSSAVSIENGECIVSDIKDIEMSSLPVTLETVILGFIDKLTDTQQMIVKCASVAGRVIPMSLLLYISRLDPKVVERELQKLVEMNVFQPAAPSVSSPRVIKPPSKNRLEKVEERSYVFVTASMAEIAYNTLLFSQRREFHRAGATWYEDNGLADTSYGTLLVHHWRSAGDKRKTAFYLERAAEQLLKVQATRDAVRYMQEAIELNDEIDGQEVSGVNKREHNRNIHQAALHQQLGQALLDMGKQRAGKLEFERALGLMGIAMPKATFSMVLGVLWETGRQLCITLSNQWRSNRYKSTVTQVDGNGYDASRGNNNNKNEDHGTAGTNMIAVKIHQKLFELYYFRADTWKCLFAATRSLAYAQITGSPVELALSYAICSSAAGLIPIHYLGRACSQYAAKLAAELKEMPNKSLAWLLYIIAVYRIGIGDWDQAEGALVDAIQISSELDMRRAEECVNTLAYCAFLQGDYEVSVQLCYDVYESAYDRDDRQTEAWGLLGQARGLLALGNSDEALTLLNQRDTVLSETGGHSLGESDNGSNMSSDINALGLFALTYLQKGDEGEAATHAEKALHMIKKVHRPSVYLFPGFASTVEVLLTLAHRASPKQSQHFLSLAKHGIQALNRFSTLYYIGQPRLFLFRGICAWLDRDSKTAFRCWNAAFAAAERLQWPAEQDIITNMLHTITGNPEILFGNQGKLAT